MPSGGKRKGAGAPIGNRNALKHGGRAKVIYGVPLNKVLSPFEYKALCLEQMAALKELNEIDGGSGYSYSVYLNHKHRYLGAIEFNERKQKTRSEKTDRAFNKYFSDAMKRFRST